MCHLCLSTPPLLTRRAFLQLGAAALLAACSRQPAGSPGRWAGQPATAELGQPTLAGQITAASETSLTLASPSASRTLALSPRVRLFDSTGQPAKQLLWRVGETAVLWINPLDPAQAEAVRLLPRISAAATLPADLVQPAPTGEKRPFGSIDLVTRAGWGAAPTEWVIGGESGPYDPTYNPGGWLVYPEPLAAQLHTLIVHHSALEFYDGPQAVQALHMRESGFADVGYHFMIDGFGGVYEGRPLNVRGAHAAGYNTGYVGVCLLGNFEIAPALSAQLQSLQQLTDYLRSAYTLSHIGGHRDFQPNATVCPGKNLLPHIHTLAQTLQMGYGPHS